MRLAVETALARAAGRLSRVAGRGGGTTLPGKILTTIDSQAVGRLARRLPEGTALVSATNGKTTTTAMVARILSPRLRLAHNRAGANLASGIASTLMDAAGAELGVLEVDEGAFPAIAPLNIMGLTSPISAILSAVIFNALIIIALIPLALRGVKYRPVGAAVMLRRNLLVYGLGGIIIPFVGIKMIDVLINALHLV
jgi:hypothetical protein